jgi:hypothetical protein
MAIGLENQLAHFQSFSEFRFPLGNSVKHFVNGGCQLTDWGFIVK